jgi:hypothetical protein
LPLPERGLRLQRQDWFRLLLRRKPPRGEEVVGKRTWFL